MVQEGADAKTSGMFYVSLVQYILLFGVDTWVVTPCILKALYILNNRAAHQISSRFNQQQRNVIWVYPPISETLMGALLSPFGYYITCRKNNLAQYITMWPIYDITVAKEMIIVSSDLLHW